MVRFISTRGIVARAKKGKTYRDRTVSELPEASTDPEKEEEVLGSISNKETPPSVSQELLEEILIAIKKLPESLRSMLYSSNGAVVSQQSLAPIQLDETIIDVGIGVQAELEKGKGASSGSKEEIKSDMNLSSAKSKLKQLRKRPLNKKKNDQGQ